MGEEESGENSSPERLTDLPDSEAADDSVQLVSLIIERKNPTSALLRSAALPGWGQFYNEKPLKGIIFGTVEIGLAVWLVQEHLAAERARKDYLISGDPADEASYYSHRNRRLDLIWYTAGAWIIGMLDAYVDAYLFSFDVENEQFEEGIGFGIHVIF